MRERVITSCEIADMPPPNASEDSTVTGDRVVCRIERSDLPRHTLPKDDMMRLMKRVCLITDLQSQATKSNIIYSINNAITIGLSASTYEAGTDVWDWLIKNPDKFIETGARTMSTSYAIMAYKYTWLLLTRSGLLATGMPEYDHWWTVRGRVLSDELSERDDRLQRLLDKDLRLETLQHLQLVLPRGSNERLWLALMLYNSPMRAEFSALFYCGSRETSPEWARGSVDMDQITLWSTKLTSRTDDGADDE